MSDPIRLWRRRLVAMWLLGGPLVLAALLWSFQDSGMAPRAVPQLETGHVRTGSESSDTQRREPVDMQLFTARLSYSPPEAMREPAPTDGQLTEVAVTPLRFQLIGITSEGGHRAAALYDPDSDRLFIVRDGDRIQSFVVTAVTERGVELQSPAGQHRLDLVDVAPDTSSGGSS